jgi:hypothetical protein
LRSDEEIGELKKAAFYKAELEKFSKMKPENRLEYVTKKGINYLDIAH